MKTILIISFSLTFIALPAIAQLGNAWRDFQLYTIDLQDYLKDNIRTTLEPVELETIGAINNATGVVNIPNPIRVKEDITETIVLNSISETFENNPSVQANITSNEIDRQITRGAIASFFGRQGQERLQIKLEATEETINNISNIAQNLIESDNDIINSIQGTLSQGNGVTALAQLLSNQANLQADAIRIESEQSKLIGENLSQNISLNNSLQYSNLNLVNISQQLEEENRARRVYASAEAARLLRASSQTDLFGRIQD
ncbi:MAG: hypothetical protein AAF378_07380 [Cyanobacteria bacterium P01_A01_bin.84]